MIEVIIILIIFGVFKNTDKDQRKSAMFKGISSVVAFMIAIQFFMFLIPIMFATGISFSFSFMPFIVLAVGIFFAGTIYKKIKRRIMGLGGSNSSFNNANNTASGSDINSVMQEAMNALPKSNKKRRNIVAAFSKKNDLYLTDEEIKRIVDSSYMSASWKMEIAAMNMKYESIYQWFSGNTAWLRAYMYVFKVQNISSDFYLMQKIVFDSFDEIFRYIGKRDEFSLDDILGDINNTFMTSFDDVTFMIAYRYLQSNGKTYDLGKISILKNEDQVDKMKQKYTI